MRKKITISLQSFELEVIDIRAKALDLTRSAYLKCLVLRDTQEKKDQRKRRVSDWIERKQKSPLL